MKKLNLLFVTLFIFSFVGLSIVKAMPEGKIKNELPYSDSKIESEMFKSNKTTESNFVVKKQNSLNLIPSLFGAFNSYLHSKNSVNESNSTFSSANDDPDPDPLTNYLTPSNKGVLEHRDLSDVVLNEHGEYCYFPLQGGIWDFFLDTNGILASRDLSSGLRLFYIQDGLLSCNHQQVRDITPRTPLEAFSGAYNKQYVKSLNLKYNLYVEPSNGMLRVIETDKTNEIDTEFGKGRGLGTARTIIDPKSIHGAFSSKEYYYKYEAMQSMYGGLSIVGSQKLAIGLDKRNVLWTSYRIQPVNHDARQYVSKVSNDGFVYTGDTFNETIVPNYWNEGGTLENNVFEITPNQDFFSDSHVLLPKGEDKACFMYLDYDVGVRISKIDAYNNYVDIPSSRRNVKVITEQGITSYEGIRVQQQSNGQVNLSVYNGDNVVNLAQTANPLFQFSGARVEVLANYGGSECNLVLMANNSDGSNNEVVWDANNGLNPLYKDPGFGAPQKENKSCLKINNGKGEVLYEGQSLISENGLYKAVMQGDGNFVIYDIKKGCPLWATNTMDNGQKSEFNLQGDGNLVVYSKDASLKSTVKWSPNVHGRGGNKLVMQNDGNLVLYRATDLNSCNGGGQVVWASGTAQPVINADEKADDRLLPNEYLVPGQSLVSQNKKYSLIFQGDRNIVLYAASDNCKTRVLWSTKTNGTGTNKFIQQTDGNLVAYAGNKATWASNRNGCNPKYTVLQGDANLVTYFHNCPPWASNTVDPTPPKGTINETKPTYKPPVVEYKILSYNQRELGSEAKLNLEIKNNGQTDLVIDLQSLPTRLTTEDNKSSISNVIIKPGKTYIKPIKLDTSKVDPSLVHGKLYMRSNASTTGHTVLKGTTNTIIIPAQWQVIYPRVSPDIEISSDPTGISLIKDNTYVGGQLSEYTYDFGTITLEDGAKSAKIRVTNNGNSDLNLSDIVINNGAFKVDNNNFATTTIAPAATIEFNVTFDIANRLASQYTGSIRFKTNDIIPTTDLNYGEQNIVINFKATSQPTPVPEVELSSTPEGLAIDANASIVGEKSNYVFDLGTIPANSTKSVKIIVSNDGNEDLIYQGTPQYDDQGGAFTIDRTLIDLIPSFSSQSFNVSINSTGKASGEYLAKIDFGTNDETPDDSGFGETDISIIVKARIITAPEFGFVPQAGLLIDTTSNNTYIYDFGTVEQGSTDPFVDLTIENLGTAALDISNINGPNAPFSFDQTLGFSLTPGSSSPIRLTFDTATVGDFEDNTALFNTNDLDESNIRIIVKGKVVDGITTGDLELTGPSGTIENSSFGNTRISTGEATVKRATFRNISADKSIKLGYKSESGCVDIAPFAEVTLAPGESKEVDFGLTGSACPRGASTYSGVFTSNAINVPSGEVTITGDVNVSGLFETGKLYAAVGGNGGSIGGSSALVSEDRTCKLTITKYGMTLYHYQDVDGLITTTNSNNYEFASHPLGNFDPTNKLMRIAYTQPSLNLGTNPTPLWAGNTIVNNSLNVQKNGLTKLNYYYDKTTGNKVIKTAPIPTTSINALYVMSISELLNFVGGNEELGSIVSDYKARLKPTASGSDDDKLDCAAIYVQGTASDNVTNTLDVFTPTNIIWASILGGLNPDGTATPLVQARSMAEEVTAYPNPTFKELNLVSKTKLIRRVLITDASGKVKLEKNNINGKIGDLVTINVSNLLPGLYHVTTYDENNNITDSKGVYINMKP